MGCVARVCGHSGALRSSPAPSAALCVCPCPVLQVRQRAQRGEGPPETRTPGAAEGPGSEQLSPDLFHAGGRPRLRSPQHGAGSACRAPVPMAALRGPGQWPAGEACPRAGCSPGPPFESRRWCGCSLAVQHSGKPRKHDPCCASVHLRVHTAHLGGY